MATSTTHWDTTAVRSPRALVNSVTNPPISNGLGSSSSRGHVQFLGGSDTAVTHILAIIVVSPELLHGEVLRLLDAFNDVLVQPLVSDGAVVALDVGVLLRLTRLDML